MPEPIEQPNEIAVLKQTLADVRAKATARKARITELETQVATLTTNLNASQTALQDITVNAPLRQMAEAVSPVPDIWLAEFGKHYKAESKDGKLSLLTIAGEPALDSAGKPLEFTQSSLISHFTKTVNPIFKPFQTIMASSNASGGGATGASAGRPTYAERTPATPQAKPSLNLGLR
jgi:hypothetical protein